MGRTCGLVCAAADVAGASGLAVACGAALGVTAAGASGFPAACCDEREATIAKAPAQKVKTTHPRDRKQKNRMALS
jgi:hypothetical protein